MSVPEAVDARELVGELPAFSLLPEEVRILVAESFEPIAFPFGAVIVREGEPADAFYVLAAGSARVVKQGDDGEEVPLNVLRRGDSFGEMSLLGETVRLATVRASTAVHALRLGRSVFAALTRAHPQVREAFEALANERALAVVEGLLQAGVPAARIDSRAAGAAADGGDDALDRRVDITIIR
jgi:ATP-binding cassette subfamily B protein